MTVASLASPALKAASWALSTANGLPASGGIEPGERPSVPWQLAQAPASSEASASCAAAAPARTAASSAADARPPLHTM